MSKTFGISATEEGHWSKRCCARDRHCDSHSALYTFFLRASVSVKVSSIRGASSAWGLDLKGMQFRIAISSISSRCRTCPGDRIKYSSSGSRDAAVERGSEGMFVATARKVCTSRVSRSVRYERMPNANINPDISLSFEADKQSEKRENHVSLGDFISHSLGLSNDRCRSTLVEKLLHSRNCSHMLGKSLRRVLHFAASDAVSKVMHSLSMDSELDCSRQRSGEKRKSKYPYNKITLDLLQCTSNHTHRKAMLSDRSLSRRSV